MTLGGLSFPIDYPSMSGLIVLSYVKENSCLSLVNIERRAFMTRPCVYSTIGKETAAAADKNGDSCKVVLCSNTEEFDDYFRCLIMNPY